MKHSPSVTAVLTPRIRPMIATDAEAVAALSGQLGYPMTAAQVRERLTLIGGRPDSAFFVAVTGREVRGWVHVYGVPLLESPVFFAEIGGLVVDANTRRQGLGRLLMDEAERWAVAHGYPQVRLRSGPHRTDAHAFYQSLGYAPAKTSLLFCKDLA